MLSTPNVDAVNRAWDQYKKDHNRERLFDSLPADVNDSDRQLLFQLFLWRAIGLADLELIKLLKNCQTKLADENGGTGGYLFSALQEFGDCPFAIEWLLRHGSRIDARGINDWTALHQACRAGYINAVRSLVENGSDINAQTNCDGGWTPLMEAAASGKTDVVEFLLAHGADPKIQNTMEGMTARGIAIDRGYLHLVEIFDVWSPIPPEN